MARGSAVGSELNEGARALLRMIVSAVVAMGIWFISKYMFPQDKRFLWYIVILLLVNLNLRV